MKLFGRSPFAPLRVHMKKVGSCVHKLPGLFGAMKRGDDDAIGETARLISKLEHEADLTKNDIRTSLKSHLFLPVARSSLLEVLAIQDSIADSAEDAAVLCTMRSIRIPELWEDLFDSFLKKNIACVDQALSVIAELNELLESSFGGVEAEKFRSLIDHIAYTEHEVDLVQRELLRKLFTMDPELPYPVFALWLRIIEQIANLSNLSEKLGNRILMTMETK